MARLLRHAPCQECNSRDNLALYSDGTGYCFGCKTYVHADQTKEVKMEHTESVSFRDDIEDLGPSALPNRKLTAATCELFRYHIGEVKGESCHIANYYKDAELIARKIRTADKRFIQDGKTKNLGFYGQDLWRTAGKMVCITEGEIDALSLSQAQGNKWPVVSVPNGAAGASKVVQQELEWLEGFDKVVFCFDMDKVGQEAAKQCAALLTPGKAYIASLPLKDPSDMLQADRTSELVRALWDAKECRPDGVICGDDITMAELLSKPIVGYSTPFPQLDAKCRGIRKGELTLLAAGTGAGKTQLARELGYHFNRTHGLKVANVYLEEGYIKTAMGYIALHMNIPLGVLRSDPDSVGKDKIEVALNEVIRGRGLYFHNHFGSIDSKQLFRKFKYFASGIGCDFIILDHISIMVSGMESSREGERKDIDRLMTNLRSLIEETGIGVIAISHLSKTDGISHELGGQVTLDHLRGSGTLKQIPDTIISVERNQQDEVEQNIAALRVLKNREFGVLGKAGNMVYNPSTGRLTPQTFSGAY